MLLAREVLALKPERRENPPRPTNAMVPMPDRRKKRSSDVITALHYQLSSTRAEARLEAVVLVDPSGCLVAGAGAWPVCEELAAYAPLLAHRGDIRNATVGSRIAALTGAVCVQALFVDGGEAILCGRGGAEPGRRASLEQAAEGCRRILRSAA
jgi:hypothetical protein